MALVANVYYNYQQEQLATQGNESSFYIMIKNENFISMAKLEVSSKHVLLKKDQLLISNQNPIRHQIRARYERSFIRIHVSHGNSGFFFLDSFQYKNISSIGFKLQTGDEDDAHLVLDFSINLCPLCKNIVEDLLLAYH